MDRRHAELGTEPGGYLQWEDADIGRLKARVPEGTNISDAASQGLVQFLSMSGKRVGLLDEYAHFKPPDAGFALTYHCQLGQRSARVSQE